jgi:hypothetical protein
MSEFAWNADDADSIVLGWQPRTAVYSTQAGGICVRQECDGYTEDRDDQVLLTPMGALAVAWEMIRVAHEIGFPAPPPEARKALNLGPPGPVVHRPSPAEPGSLLAVMEAANGEAERQEAAE